MMKIRFILWLSLMGWAFYSGGIRNAFYVFLLIGFLLFVYYMIEDAFHRVAGLFHRTPAQVTNNFNMDGNTQARRGVPADPTTEEWGGIITVGREHYKHTR